MIKAIISDFSRVLLFPKDKNYSGSLNGLHKEMSVNPQYKFLEHFELNKELLEFYKSLKDTVNLYMFTSETIQDTPELQPDIQPVFKKIFSASKMNINKKESSAYETLTNSLQLKSNEIVYIDDSPENIDAAAKAGLKTILYSDNSTLISQLRAMLKFE
jgi:FMN phosphatase YigB (HAD superfamily)